MTFLKLRKGVGAHRPRGWDRYMNPGETIDERDVPPDHRDKFEVAETPAHPSPDGTQAPIIDVTSLDSVGGLPPEDPEDDVEEVGEASPEANWPPLRSESETGPMDLKLFNGGAGCWFVVDDKTGQRINPTPLKRSDAVALLRQNKRRR